MTRLERCIVTAGGLGFLKPAPGTWGSLPPVVLALALVLLALPARQIDVALLLFGAIFAIGCVRFGGSAEEAFGKKDPGRVVADEVAGQAIALLAMPWPTGDLLRAALYAGTAFLFFRLCDIVKPWPARSLQALHGGWGILIDDLIAGVYALGLTQLTVRMWLVP